MEKVENKEVYKKSEKPLLLIRHLSIEFVFEMFVWSAQQMHLLFILQEFEVQPLVQIEAEPAKNPEPAENPDVCSTFFSKKYSNFIASRGVGIIKIRKCNAGLIQKTNYLTFSLVGN